MKLTCKEATRLVSQGLDRKLGLWDRLRLRIHLVICDACTAFAKQMGVLRRAIQRLS